MTYLWWKAAVLAIAGLVALGKVVDQASRRASARERMRSGQRELADNTAVTLTGTVKLIGEPLIAPLSGTPCVFHRSTLRILSERKRAIATTFDNPLELTKQQMIPFVLVTPDGEVYVEGDDAEVTLRPSPIIPRKLDREIAFLRAADLELDPRQTGVDEIVITAGMKIAVHGVARVTVVPGEAQFREAPTRVTLVAHDRHPLTIDLA